MRCTLLAALLSLLLVSCSDEMRCGSGLTAVSAWRTKLPENARPYLVETMARLEKLLVRGGWETPAWSEAGLLETMHVKTGLTLVLVPGGDYSMGTAE